MTYSIREQELRPSLAQVLTTHYGRPRHITNLKRERSIYGTSFLIEELTVSLDGGEELSLIFKDLSWRSLSEDARGKKHKFLYDPLREINVYRNILANRPLGQAICYGAGVDQDKDRYWLFLENVPGPELYQTGEFEKWQGVARWLAGFHAQFAPDPTRLLREAPLLRYNRPFYQRWLDRALAFANDPGQGASDETRRQLAWLADRYENVIAALEQLPQTFIHGEFYAANVLVEQLPAGLRVTPVDWEMAAVGPGILDLAALTAGKWTEEQKEALARAYYEGLPRGQQVYPSFAALLRALDYGHLYVSMLWLGWTAEIAPPAESGLNWLAEALRLAEKLDLQPARSHNSR
ncbi:MAG: aminoglycoside phosphotransferase family protein [Candidatus Promineifilaceae bacterium]